MEGKEVKDVVLDTGTTRTFVRDSLVARNRSLIKFVSVQCMHGDYAPYPLAKVEVVIEGKSYFMETAVVMKLPTSMLLERDVPELVRIGSAEPTGTVEEALTTVMRAQAKRKNESAAKEKEKDAGVACKNLSKMPVTQDPVEEEIQVSSPEDDAVEKKADLEQEDTPTQGDDEEVTTNLEDESLGGADGKELR